MCFVFQRALIELLIHANMKTAERQTSKVLAGRGIFCYVFIRVSVHIPDSCYFCRRQLVYVCKHFGSRIHAIIWLFVNQYIPLHFPLAFHAY